MKLSYPHYRQAWPSVTSGDLSIDQRVRSVHLAAADVASLNAQITANDLDAAAANLRAQIDYLSTVDSWLGKRTTVAP